MSFEQLYDTMPCVGSSCSPGEGFAFFRWYSGNYEKFEPHHRGRKGIWYLWWIGGNR